MRIATKNNSVILGLLLSSGCVGITASRYNEEDQCWEEGVEVASEVRIFGGCNDAAVHTKKDGEYWLFSNGCVPSGYIRVSPEEGLRPSGTPCE